MNQIYQKKKEETEFFFEESIKQNEFKEKEIRNEFHGCVDFYYLIKGIANEFSRINDLDDTDVKIIINKYIERNFGGIEYEIDNDLINHVINNIIKKNE